MTAGRHQGPDPQHDTAWPPRTGELPVRPAADDRPEPYWTPGAVAAVVAGALFLLSFSPTLIEGTVLFSYGWRAGLLVLLLGAIVEGRGAALDPYTLRAFGPWAAMLCLFAVFSFDQAEVWLMLARSLVLLVFVSLLVGSALRTQSGVDMIRVFFWTIFLGLAMLSVLAALDLLRGGWTWDLARIAKAQLREEGRLSSNTAVFILALCIFHLAADTWRRLLPMLLFLTGLSVILVTRTPIAAAFLTLLSVGACGWLLRHTGAPTARLIPWVLASVLVIVTLGVALAVAHSDSPSIAHALAGRPYLWQAALDQWSSAPWFGQGLVTATEALELSYSVLNFSESWEIDSLLALESGGFHSIWFQTLIGFGLAGLLVLLLSFLRLTARALSPEGSRNLALVVFFLLFRSHLESSGLFASGNSPLDFLCVLAVAHGAMTAATQAQARAAS